MCIYCEVKEDKKAFKKDKIHRGELLLNDCDVDIYIEYDDYEYSLTAECWCGNIFSGIIKYCPMCGKKLL